MGAAAERARIRRLMGSAMLRALSAIAAERNCKVADLPVEQAAVDELVLATWATCEADRAARQRPTNLVPAESRLVGELHTGVSPSSRPTAPPPADWSAPDEDITPLVEQGYELTGDIRRWLDPSPTGRTLRSQPPPPPGARPPGPPPIPREATRGPKRRP